MIPKETPPFEIEGVFGGFLNYGSTMLCTISMFGTSPSSNKQPAQLCMRQDQPLHVYHPLFAAKMAPPAHRLFSNSSLALPSPRRSFLPRAAHSAAATRQGQSTRRHCSTSRLEEEVCKMGLNNRRFKVKLRDRFSCAQTSLH